MSNRRRLSVAVATVLLLPLAAIQGAAAATGPTSTKVTVANTSTAPAPGEQIDRAIVDLPHSVSLLDAVSASSSVPEVIGFHFASSWNEGEYFLGDAMSPQDFADTFQLYYGTQVQVTGLVVETPGTAARSSALTVNGIDEALARASAAEHFEASEPTSSLVPEVGGDPLSAATSESGTSISPMAGPDGNAWAPNYTETYTMDLSIAGHPEIHAIGTYNEWSPASAEAQLRYPSNMPSDWGLEIDIYLKNPSIVGTRPNCYAGTKDNFWATKYDTRDENQVISWSVSKADGGAISAGSTHGSAEPYFDWNTDSDSCGVQSFAIGLGNPAGIGLSTARHATPYYGVNTSIWAPQGKTGSSQLGGYYQAVSNDCNDLGSLATSSCMGLNTSRVFPSGPQSQKILEPSNRTAPHCYGTSAATSPPNAWEISCY